MVAELNIFSKTLNKTEKFGEDFPQERVGLIGGSFNPPHIAHLIMAEQARVQLGLDKVYFLPSHIPPHVDEKKTIDASTRVEMTRLAIQDNIYFDIETIAEATGSTIIQVIGHTIVLYKEARNPKHRDLSVRFAEFKKRGR